MLVVCVARGAARATGAPVDGKTAQLLGRYIDNPAANRRAVRALDRKGLEGLPDGALIAVGDAYMRSGDNLSAIGVFATLLDRNPGRPVSSIAEIAIGWALLAEGDVATARTFFAGALAVETASPTSADAQRPSVFRLADIALLAVSLTDAYQGAGAGAAEPLGQLAVAPGTDAVLRPLARLGAAYAHYWIGDYASAAAVFDYLALEYPDGPTADDARYGAAWSRWLAGDRERALDDLHDLARSDRPSAGRGAAALVDLRPADVLVAGLRDDRRPIASPAQRLAGVLDLDGVALARAAIRRIERGDDSRDATEPAVAPVGAAPEERGATAARADGPGAGQKLSLAVPVMTGGSAAEPAGGALSEDARAQHVRNAPVEAGDGGGLIGALHVVGDGSKGSGLVLTAAALAALAVVAHVLRRRRAS
ncbi:MAG TPA: tetratricopeptide repeat protein [Candidatus Binatia bacterium]|nr:tetratricopeptide repeat protein [Candidatus Binatia bacterium]